MKGGASMGDKPISKKLKELREEKGYLQKFVADKIGVRSNTLSGYENGNRYPDLDMILKLAELYDVSTDYLLGRTNNRNSKTDRKSTRLNSSHVAISYAVFCLKT